nr:hypothetical protein [Shewanella dokdonensis]
MNSSSHAQQLRDAAVAMGANPNRILELPDARDTIEEALALRQAFGAAATDMGDDAVGGVNCYS